MIYRYHCLNCHTFISGCLSPLWRAAFHTATSGLLQIKPLKSMKLSRAVTLNPFSYFFIFIFSIISLYRVSLHKTNISAWARINPQVLFKILPSNSLSYRFRDEHFRLASSEKYNI